MKLSILGTRGLPARHGGFETFAQHLAPYLVERGWQVAVYCQDDTGMHFRESRWRGVRLLHVPTRLHGPLGTIEFDCKSVWHASRSGGVILTLGYNTAVLSVLYRMKGIKNLINMDGIEWRRQKWTMPEKAWLYLNDLAGCWLGDHLIADHPDIESHLATRVSRRKITMIPYGAREITSADPSILTPFDLAANSYALVIARAEPENSLLEIVSSFSRKRRGIKLAVLGRYEPQKNRYHRRVLNAASSEVTFLGPVYDPEVVAGLRFYSRLYVHGHSVGGTNPSLVEALGAGCAVLAHDNIYTRWVAGPNAHYFGDAEQCARKFDDLLFNSDELMIMKEASRARFQDGFQWNSILADYEGLLSEWAAKKVLEKLPIGEAVSEPDKQPSLAASEQ